MSEILDARGIVERIVQWLGSNYWGPMHSAAKANPALLNSAPGFLLKPEKIVLYLGRTHLGMEYVGPERVSSLPERLPISIAFFDHTNSDVHLLDNIIGFGAQNGFRLPLPALTIDLVLPTNAGAEELDRLSWNWSAQEMVLGLNFQGIEAPAGQFTRLVNARFFDADGPSGLKTRHIKWLDLIPLDYDGSNSEFDAFEFSFAVYQQLIASDLLVAYPLPDDFRLARLQQMNRFVEFIGDRRHSEPDITRLLATKDLSFALKMRFAAKDVFPECPCEWQSEDREAIKPDFFVVGPNGYADIVEFKRPELSSAATVGAANRQAFSATINAHLAQTRVYRDYFDDPRNRSHVKTKFGFEVYKPKRHLVLGRRWDFSGSEWRTIAADYQDVTIHTYDDLVDGVVMQFYD
ncbi:MAG: DUF4263 domain-containing protein [Planctomycetaceae bacterium]|nr:DUF4263 domain-containing protein [Planctomycetaceae bacterium]